MATNRMLLAIAVMTAFVFGAAATPIAAGASQRRCADRQHPCGATEAVVSCCCGHQHDARQPATADSAAQRVGAPATTGSAPIVPAVVPVVRHERREPARARGSPPDLQTLYSTFLI